MNITEYVLEQQNREFIGIPLQLPRLNSLMNGIDKGDFWIVTGQTSTFKSSFVLSELVLPSVSWVLEQQKLKGPDCKLDIKVFYFLLEENRRDLEMRVLSYLFDKELHQQVSENQLAHRNGESMTKLQKYLAPDLNPLIEQLLSKITVFDSIRHGYGQARLVKEYMDANGTVSIDPQTGEKTYVPNNPDEYVLMVVDHVGDMIPAKDEKTLYQAIENLTSTYILPLKNTYRVIPIIIQQQKNVGDQIATDYKGKTIDTKLSPSTAELADNGTTAKRATQIISLFNPSSYELDKYKGYTGLDSMKENWLYLNILKNRRGPKNKGSGLWVNPVTKVFTEYPAASDTAGIVAFRREMGIQDAAEQKFGFGSIITKTRSQKGDDFFQ